MSGTAGDVIRVAKSQVGYHEGYSGGHWDNKQKYSPAVPGLEWSQNQAWCATFMSWCFQEAGMPKGSYPVTASVATARDWWKQHGRFSQYPAVGAQCIMGASGDAHTGLVYAYDATYIYTVEGNTNSSGAAEGDGVYLKKRARRDAYVYGYGYPAYPGGIVTADPAWKNPEPSTKGDTTNPKEDGMQLTDTVKLSTWVKKTWPKDKGLQDNIEVNTAIGSGYAHARRADENSLKILAQVAALAAAVQSLARDGGLPLAQVQAAAEAGAKAALTQLGDTLSKEA